jgi:hypothetical protein
VGVAIDVSFSIAAQTLKFFPRFHPAHGPRQFEPLFFVARMIWIARVSRIELANNPLFSLDSPTHYYCLVRQKVVNV